MSSQSVGVEVATVTLRAGQRDFLDSIFVHLDEQVVSPSLRQRMAENGLRAGLLGGQLPEPISLLLMEAADRRKHPTAESQQYADEQRFVQCRAEKSSPAKIWEARDLAVTYYNGDFPSTEILSQADTIVSVFGSPLNGGASVRLVPEMEYGPIRQKYVVQDNAFHMEAQRDRRTYDDLALELPLRPGEVLMVTANSWPEDSIGRRFFVHGEQQKILLIRLAQTPVEDGFEMEFAVQE